MGKTIILILLPTVRRSEYTGENRCWPCTGLNLVIVAVVALAAGFIQPLLGVLTGSVCLVLIYLRGYVVPGTPRFGPQIAALLPIQFEHTGAESYESDSLAGDVDPEQLLNQLVEAGILRVDGEQLRLDRSFRDEWERRMAELREMSETELVTRTAAVVGDDVRGEVLDDRFLLTGDGRDTMLRPTVAIAETAAAETFAAYDVSERIRAPAAGPLKTFLRICPACGGSVQEMTIQNCCGGPGSIHSNPERPALVCSECETVVHVFRE